MDHNSISGTGGPPPLLPGPTPPPPPAPGSRPLRQPVAILLNLCLGLFLADGVVSLVDDSSILLFDFHFLAGLRGILVTFAILTALVTYGLMGLTPMIPKRVFLPVTLFTPVSLLVGVPFLIYYYNRAQRLDWVSSVCQVVVGLCVLRYLQGGFRLRWPLMPERMLGSGRFNWANLAAFWLTNLVVVVPGVMVYLVVCAALAVDHFSEGFVALRPAGFTVQVRQYVRNDGKTILLVPMSHVGEPEFYRSLAEGFPTNSTILMEGVTDHQNLLTNRITYKRMASSLGLAPQEKQFKPNPVQMVMSDIDVDRFATNTIDFLNVVMLVHSRGLNAANLLQLVQYPQPPDFEKELFDDLLSKRNRHLLQQIQEHLLEENHLIVPWGAAHMPELAREIQKSGFRLADTREYTAIRFAKRAK